MRIKSRFAYIVILLLACNVALISRALGADEVQAKYVGKSSCTPQLWESTGSYGIRLDKTQNAYLAAHTVQGKSILLIVKYAKEGDKCGTIRDVVQSKDAHNYFEFVCVDCSRPSVVVVGTWPEKNSASSGTAVEAWRIDLKELNFVRVNKKVSCVRRSYEGTDAGEDVATWARKGIARHCPALSK